MMPDPMAVFGWLAIVVLAAMLVALARNEGQQELFDREAQIKKELGFG